MPIVVYLCKFFVSKNIKQKHFNVISLSVLILADLADFIKIY